jgi:hypothetical protein
MGEMEKSMQETDKILFNIHLKLIRYDFKQSWQILKKYRLKTDIDIIFIFKFQIKLVLIQDISFCSHFILTKL